MKRMNQGKIAFIFIILIAIACLLFSCSDLSREKIVDKSELTGRDYRLFQNTPAWELAKAVEDENTKKIDKIVSENPEIINYQESKYGNTLLMLTIMNQQLKPFKALLKRGADVNIHNTFDGTSSLIKACSSKFYNITFVKMLIEYGADVNDVEIGERRKENGTRLTPLIAASRTGRLDLVRFLVSKGADVNYQNEFGQSALSKSVMVDEYKVAYYLLQNGADYNRPIYYRFDNSVPIEKRDPKDKGKPMYLWDVLKEDLSEFGTSEYKYKMLIIDFLKSKDKVK
ncbi:MULTISPECIES: ankyrin repeat domain-containing protein [Bacteroidales]|uniref:ankyrin repeat domain-containing protein n=1 Tax=Bacteroidales TaxID=171549 RepID=UPI0025A4C70C|nr:ankyrin repeat domain-containing protein [Barnesiella viscericola]MDM8269963.1 ankyrin repeat domain-containing protein [Barnesiella viscericola]